MNILLLAVSVAAALAVPALAQKAPVAAAPARDSMSPDQAMSVVDAAVKEAGSRNLDSVPVEFARALIVMPYGPQVIEEDRPENPTAQQVKISLGAARAFWTRVHDALARELANTPDDEPIDEAISYVGPNTARKMALSRHLQDCNRILADIAADEKVDSATPGQSIIDRKKALAQELAPRRAKSDDRHGPCP